MLAFSAIYPASGQTVASLSEVNSPFDEQHPVISPAGDLFFTVAFHNESPDPGDVWHSSMSTEEVFQAPTRVPELSTSGYDVVVGFLDPINILVYHDGREKKQGIHQYTLAGNSWSYTRQLDITSFRNLSDHFSGRLSPSGDVLILSLESYGSYGNEDIYVSFLKETGTWTAPQNLGPAINTYQQEMTPYLSEDKRSLFFSTNGHGTTRGRDIYSAQRLDESWENWSSPQPLTYGNTTGAELSYFPMGGEKNLAIFTTTQNSEGYGDLRIIQAEPVTAERDEEQPDEVATIKPEPAQNEESATPTTPAPLEEKIPEEEKTIPSSEPEQPLSPELPATKPTQTDEKTPEAEALKESGLSLKVVDKNSLEEIDYSVSFTDRGGSTFLMEDSVDDNQFPVDLQAIKEVLVTSPGYLPLTIKEPAFSQLEEPVLMTPASKGASMALEEVLFKRGTAELLDESSAAFIDRLAEFLKDNADVRILLEGHTDNLGNPQLNKELSLDRASAIRSRIVGQGVEFERIRIAGWGGSRPIATNQNEEGRTKNRRVELVIQ